MNVQNLTTSAAPTCSCGTWLDQELEGKLLLLVACTPMSPITSGMYCNGGIGELERGKV